VLIVIDNFVSDDDPILADLQSEETWENLNEAENPRICTNWIDKDGTATNVFEAITNKIWAYAQGILPEEYDGMEYWYSTLNNVKSLDMHRDKDEAHMMKTGRLVHPYVGSIYYCHKELPEGGFLQIDRPESGEGYMERLQPVPNRLIIFDSDSYHGVTQIHSGIRRHVASNIWINKPDEDNFTTGRYKELVKDREEMLENMQT